MRVAIREFLNNMVWAYEADDKGALTPLANELDKFSPSIKVIRKSNHQKIWGVTISLDIEKLADEYEPMRITVQFPKHFKYPLLTIRERMFGDNNE